MVEENKWTPEELTCIAMMAEHVGQQAEKMARDFLLDDALRITTSISSDGVLGVIVAEPGLIESMRDGANDVLELDRVDSTARTHVEDPDDGPCQN